MDTVTLNNGVEMPALGFGVYQIPAPECRRSVETALGTGYRLIDTASAYLNEEAVGAAIRTVGTPREELFVTTKLWVQDAGEKPARKAFERSLTRLGLDYLDLYLIHQPYGDYYGSWRAMTALLQEGLVRAIGVCNFAPDQLVDLADHNEVTPAVNQIETHIFHQRRSDQQVAAGLGTAIEAWAPFAEGRRGIFSEPALKRLARAHDRTVAQVLLRWLIQRGIVAIPKSVRPERIAENFDIGGFHLTDEEMVELAGLDTRTSLFLDHRDPEVTHQLGTSVLDI